MIARVLVIGIVELSGVVLALNVDEWFDPVQVRARNFLPAVGYQPDIALGQSRYQEVCARCHGVSLNGSSEGPPLIDATYAPAHHADLSFYHAVKNGVKQHHWQFGDMPMLTGLTPGQVSDIVLYVRKNQQLAGIQ